MSNALLRRWGLLSPITALSLSLAIAALSILFPRAYYEGVMGEQDFVYHDLRTALYVAMCASAFLIGFAFHKYVFVPVLKPSRQEKITSNKEPLYLLLTIGISIACLGVSLYTLIVLYTSIPSSFVVSALSGDISSTLLRDEVEEIISDQNLGIALNASSAFVPWMMFVVLRCPPKVRKTPLGILAIALMLGLVPLICVNAALQQTRGAILYAIFAAFVVWCAVRMAQGRLSIRRLVLVGLTAFAFAIAYFALLEITRSWGSADAVSLVGKQLLAYYVGAYNRLAAMLNGTLMFPSEGGYYWTQWIWEMPLVSNLLDLQRLAIHLFGAVGPSTWEDAWPYVYSAGLLKDMNVVTVFGYTYNDFGWFGFLPFIIYGFVSGLTWEAFRTGSVWAIIIYPYVLWSIVEWRGYIEITRASNFDTLIVLAVVVVVGRFMAKKVYLPSNVRLRRPRVGGGWTGVKRGS